MAHTYSAASYRDVWGTRYVRRLVITLVDNYVTGGWPITAQDLGFGRTSKIESVVVTGPGDAAAVFFWDHANQKLMARDWAGAEIANASAALAGKTVQLLAIATGTQT